MAEGTSQKKRMRTEGGETEKEPDPKKPKKNPGPDRQSWIEWIDALEQPTSLAEIKNIMKMFLQDGDMCTRYGDWMPKLIELTQNGKEFQWEAVHREEFRLLKSGWREKYHDPNYEAWQDLNAEDGRDLHEKITEFLERTSSVQISD